ncbi:MAG: helix-turn-helix domain-containing protein [Pseudomonadota bacterium]|nr:TetR family transcriptional regulator [Pseudomonadales bacterium]MDY6921899.1 helix-turn-helix domain-containing protein [Pseudomonadota bacterium]
MTPISDKSTNLSPAKLRILDAARRLFSVHGVGGTSLQMIADEVGVSKAAVYHQYPAKEDIVYAVGEQVNMALAAITAAALQENGIRRQRQFLISRLIELAVASRQISGALQHDPHLLRLFREQKPFRKVMDELNAVLLGPAPSAEDKVTVATMVTGIAGAVMHPLCDDVDSETLKAQLYKLTTKLSRLLN